MDPPCAQRLDCAPNEGGRSIRLEIIEQLGETSAEVQEMGEGDQSQDADPTTETKSFMGNLAEVQTISTATEDTLSEVDDMTSDAETTITLRKSLMCPIHRLPPEVLCAIFQEGLFEKTSIRDMLNTLSLASVCQYWRAVACSSGVLWSRIAFSASYKKTLAIFIERSCPDLVLSLCENSLDWASHRLIPPNRVRQLCVKIRHDLDDEDIFSSWSVMLPNLSHFWMETDRKHCVRTISGDFLSLFPNLENLGLSEVNLHFSKHFKLIKLQRIRWFVNELPWCPLGDICSHAPHLKSFVFYGPEPVDGSEATGKAFGPLTELSAIETDFYDLAIMKPLADPLMVPSLQHLAFRWVPLLFPREVNRLHDIFLHYASLASLTRLSLVLDAYKGYSRLEKSKYELDCLVHLVHLTRFDMIGVNSAEYHEGHPSVTYLCHLLSVCTPKPSFPCLQTIGFVGKIKIGVPLDIVIQMARVRTAAAASSPNEIAKLESIVFKDCEPLTVEQYRELWDVLSI